MSCLRFGRILGGISSAALAVVALAGAIVAFSCSGADVTVNRTPEGTTATVSGPDAPPVEIDREGIREPPTPTPLPITPVYPITPPAPTKTPKPG